MVALQFQSLDDVNLNVVQKFKVATSHVPEALHLVII